MSATVFVIFHVVVVVVACNDNATFKAANNDYSLPLITLIPRYKFIPDQRFSIHWLNSFSKLKLKLKRNKIQAIINRKLISYSDMEIVLPTLLFVC